MDTAALIEAVRNQPALWGKQTINTEQKNRIWKEVSQLINQPVEKCKAKWRNLRDSYQKNVKYREELREIGKMSLYHGYKHEEALSFLEVGPKRKSDDGRSRAGPSKRPKHKMFYEYSPVHDVEYIIETDNNESQNGDEEVEPRDESIFQANSGDEEPQLISRITDDQIETVSTVKHEGQGNSQNLFEYEPRADETISTQHEDVQYQDGFVNETQLSSSNAELDSWIGGIKETLLSLPKLLRARAKKQINDLVSEFEISYLESKEIENRE